MSQSRVVYCIGCLCEYEHDLINDEWICPACNNPASSGILEKMAENEYLVNENRMFNEKLKALGYSEEQIHSIALGNDVEALEEGREVPSKVIEGFEPFDLLHYSKDAFYEVVAQYFPHLTISEMELKFIVVEGEVAIKAKVIEYKKEGVEN
jgi:hypothetical protein